MKIRIEEYKEPMQKTSYSPLCCRSLTGEGNQWPSGGIKTHGGEEGPLPLAVSLTNHTGLERGSNPMWEAHF